jgi:hypothetical protein
MNTYQDRLQVPWQVVKDAPFRPKLALVGEVTPEQTTKAANGGPQFVLEDGDVIYGEDGIETKVVTAGRGRRPGPPKTLEDVEQK